MKVIMDVPDNVYEWVKNTGKFGIYRFNTAKAIKNGIPLEDVKAEITDKAIKDVNGEGFIFLGRLLRILDNRDEST